ncbi:MAG TPA: ATP-binding cassette domain-containing protein [Burkholderiales bacterium]|jgi:osmoprotectant transport system ATP-binding protein
MLELAGVSKRYREVQALAPTDLAVARGATTIFVGPSGCGKSTLLRLVAGLIVPDSGSILFEGERLSAATVNRLRVHMGYVIQEGGLFPHMTVRANVTVMARHLRWPVERVAARLRELAELAHLPESLFGRYPLELSGGQRQRVSLMRALMLDPKLLLLDEPLGALDPMIRFELQQELKAIFARLGKTVLMVTHDIAEAAYFGHTIVLLRDGKIVQQGTMAELVEAPADPFVEKFITAQRAPMEQLRRVFT